MSNFPLSPSKTTNGLIFISGQIGQKNGQLVSNNLEEQLVQTIKNIVQILEADNLTLRNVVDVTAFLVDQDDYSIFNEVYAREFQEPYPARTTVTVKSLPLGAKMELKVIASRIEFI
jgi:2-iminobutanoate/2-iminopropanoate deaminase